MILCFCQSTSNAIPLPSWVRRCGGCMLGTSRFQRFEITGPKSMQALMTSVSPPETKSIKQMPWTFTNPNQSFKTVVWKYMIYDITIIYEYITQHSTFIIFHKTTIHKSKCCKRLSDTVLSFLLQFANFCQSRFIMHMLCVTYHIHISTRLAEFYC